MAAALSTSTLRLGTWVTSPNFRHPVPLAKELITLDTMSGGRLNVGIGAGASGFDAGVLAQPTVTRAEASRRFAEFVTLLDLLLRQSVTSYDGEWFRAVEARNIPGPVQQPRPPLLVAANGPKGMRLALTQGDGWITLGSAERGADEATWWAGVASASRGFDQVAESLPEPRVGLPRYLNVEALSGSLTSVEAFRDCVGRAGELGFTDVVLAWPRAAEPFAGDERFLDDVANELVRMREAG